MFHPYRAHGCGRRTPRGGFTLVEVFVTVVIIAVLVALVMPAVQMARESARRTQCANKVKQIAVACINYASQNGAFPAAVINDYRDSSNLAHLFHPADSTRTNLRPWSVMILPFMDDTNTYVNFDLTRPFSGRWNSQQSAGSDTFGWPSNPNRAAQFQPNLAFVCPSDPNGDATALHSNYNAVMGGGPSEWQIKQEGKPRKWIRAAGNSDWIGWFSSTSGFYEPLRLYDNGMMYVSSQVTPGHVRDGMSNVFLVAESSYRAQKLPIDEYAWSWASAVWGPGNRWNGWDCCTSITTAVAAVEAINGSKPGSNLSPPGYAPVSASNPLGITGGWQFQDATYNQMQFGSHHHGGAHAALADGATHFLLNEMDLTVYQSLGDRKDGLPTGGFQK